MRNKLRAFRVIFFSCLLLPVFQAFSQRINFVDDSVTPSEVNIKDLSNDGRYVLFCDKKYIFIYDIISESYRAVLQQSKSPITLVPLSFYGSTNKIIVEQWFGSIKKGWGVITLDYSRRAALPINHLRLYSPLNTSGEYDIKMFSNIMVVEEYRDNVLWGFQVTDTRNDAPFEKINEKTKQFGATADDCETFRRYDYLVNVITGDFILIEEYYRKKSLRINVTKYKAGDNPEDDPDTSPFDSDRNILPCQTPTREYYLSEDGQSLIGFLRDTAKKETELFVFDLDTGKKKRSILYDSSSFAIVKDSVYAKVRSLDITSRKKKCYSRFYSNQSSEFDFERVFINDSIHSRLYDNRLKLKILQNPDMQGRIAKDACVFKSGNQPGKDSLYHLDYNSGLLSTYSLEKTSRAEVAIQNYDSYKKIKGTSFDVVTVPERKSRRSIETDCFKRTAHGKFQGLLVTTDSTQADSIRLNCSNKILSLYKQKKHYSVDLAQIIRQIKKSYPGASNDSVAKLIDRIYLRRVAPPLVHIHVSMIDTTSFFFIWNSKKPGIQDYYKFQNKFFPVPWSKASTGDSINYFIDLKVNATATLVDKKKYDFTVILLKYNIEKGSIHPVDSLSYLARTFKKENYNRTTYDYYNRLGLIIIHVPFKEGIILYDVAKKTTICTLDDNQENKLAREDLAPILAWYTENNAGNNHKINLKLMSRVISNKDKINQFFYVDPDSNKITFLSDDNFEEILFLSNGTHKPKQLTVDGDLWSYDFDRNFMIFSTGPESYSLYNISPMAPLLKIHFDKTKVRFTASTGREYTEIYTINSKGDNYLRHPQFNRPDIILTKLGCSDSKLRYIYSEIAKLRYARLDTALTKINPDKIPQVEIANYRDLPKIYQNPINPLISYSVDCKSCTPKKYNLWINGIPLYGDKGKIIAEQKKTEFVSDRVPLSEGRNEIEFSVQNDLGFWSPKVRYVCQYIPTSQNIIKKVYFVGVGMSAYKDSTRSLNSSDDDIRAFAKIIKERYKEDFILVDTLINIENLKTKFLQLKDSLSRSSINDKVIIMLSGHGLLSGDKLRWHFATHETNFSKPDSLVTITFDDINYLVDGIPARNRFIIIDACHAGQSFFEYSTNYQSHTQGDARGDDPVAKPVPYTLLEGFSTFEPAAEFTPLDYEAFKIMTEFFPDFVQNGSTVITASRGEQTAKEDVENGIFTKALLEVLHEAKLGTLTIEKLIEEINARFSQNQNQKPSLKSYNQSLNWIIW